MGCVAKIAAGLWNTCAIDLSGALWCWGTNAVGQLGQGNSGGADAMGPVRVASLGNEVVDVAIGGNHVCAVKQDESVWCWGYNQFGEIGDGTNTASPTPVQVGALKATALGSGVNHTCAIAPDASVWCWGFNLDEELGDGTAVNRSSPVQVASMSGALDVHGGDRFSCARAVDGTAWCWGHGAWGERGDGTTTITSGPAQVLTVGDGVSAVGTGWDFACASETDGGLACWGLGASGDIGSDAGIQPTPANVLGLPSVKSLAVGGGYVCVLDTSGVVWCFGDNDSGQVGGATPSGPTPRQVAGLPLDVSQLVAGDAHTCALRATGAILCWGANESGELGKGSPSTTKCGPFGPCERSPVAVESSCP